MNYWDIPRSDKRQRCPQCLELIRKGHFSHYNKKYLGYRWIRICEKCHQEDLRIETQNKIESKLKILSEKDMENLLNS